jgi:hypothetical protein
MEPSICYVRCGGKAAELFEEFLHSDIRDASRPGRLVESGVEIPVGNTTKKRIYR